MNYASLGVANVAAGGIPVLFPFAGRTSEDMYNFKEKEYSMPMHGFAKDMPFQTLNHEINKCSLCLRSNEMIYKEYYPFDFDLIISYTLVQGELITEMKVENRSENDMPVNIGFHPYFATTHKENVEFDFEMKNYLNFYDGNGKRGVLKGRLDLTRPLNHVFFGNAPQTMTLLNKNDGYKLKITTDESFDVTTIYTNNPCASCIEPWQNLPNSVIATDMVKCVPAKATRTYWYKIQIDNY